MNYLKTGLLVMFTLGFLSMLPIVPEGDPVILQPATASWQPDEPIGQQVPAAKTPSEPEIHPARYRGWNACNRSDGKFVGIVIETFRKDGEWFHTVAPPHVYITAQTDTNGRLMSQRFEPEIITKEAWMFSITRYTCTDGQPTRDNFIRSGKSTEEVTK